MDEALLEASTVVDTNAAIIIINDPETHVKLTASLLSEDLKHLVAEDWDWKVKQINATDFLVVFPNEVSLRLCKSAGGMTLPVSKVVVIFAEPKSDPSRAALLSKIWILLFGVPSCLCNSELLLEGTKMLGRPRLVDENSLSQDGPVRMLFHSHCPYKLPASIMLFANL
jgi:hypothetical protein